MSFLFKTFDVPLWFLIFAFASAAPLWVRWYRAFYKKFIVTEILQEKIKNASTAAEEKLEVLRKATNNWNARQAAKQPEQKKASRENLGTEAEQPYMKIVLNTLALGGDAGMLIQSLADKLEINSNAIKSSLSYLEDNEFVEVVVSGMGAKYYLAPRGKKYCIKHGYIAE